MIENLPNTSGTERVTAPTMAGPASDVAAVPPLNRRERFLRACACAPVDYPPVWMMRQAGRALPEYRELKKQYTFVQLVQNPELATEVTLQPIRRFDFDAAILFSDILVIAEALGQTYRFRETGGIEMQFPVRAVGDLAKLNARGAVERLGYVRSALQMLKEKLNGQTALLGFAGSPWTVGNFMAEGGSASPFLAARSWFQRDRAGFAQWMNLMTEVTGDYLEMQFAAGADAVQIFDTLGGTLPPQDYWDASGRYIAALVKRLAPRGPVMVFAKGVHGHWAELAATGARVLGVDSGIRLGEVAQQVPASVALQGNLEPTLLVSATPEEISLHTRQVLAELRGRPGHIFNLGHGVLPEARLDNIASVLATVRERI